MTVPSTAPHSNTTAMTSSGGQPNCSVRAAIIVDSATTDPTERSIPPVRMTKVIPTARTMRNELSISSDRNTCGSAKPL
ncbi:unannotated protein [freshwater metagenome]|uniref:Unannotated protein n=1 Tax=freshwater metagenome TaxID=449393 RepID=A0A6J7I7B4_9ZZZZ